MSNEVSDLLAGLWDDIGDGEWRTNKKGRRYISARIQLLPDTTFYLNVYPAGPDHVRLSAPIEVINTIRLALQEYAKRTED